MITFNKIFVLSIVMVLVLFSAPGFTQVTEQKIMDNQANKTYWSEVLLLAELKAHSSSKISEKFNERATTSLTAGLSLPVWSNFSIGLMLSKSNKFESSQETNRDQDIQDANGKNIRLVERTISHQYKEKFGLSYLLEYRHTFLNGNRLVPYLGFSKVKGSATSSRYDMTDREKPILFSKHNRYYLDSNSDFSKDVFILGSKYYLKKNFFFSLEFLMTQINFQNNKKSITTNGETISFNDSAFYFENFPEGSVRDNLIQIGVGVFF